MPHAVKWLLEKRVIHTEVWGDNTLLEAYDLNRTLLNYLSTGYAPVHVVQDTRQMISMPTSLLRLKEAFTYVNHPHLGWITFIGQHTVGGAVLRAAARVIPTMRYRIFLTEQEAYRFLLSKDQSLEGLFTITGEIKCPHS
ncbi:MAG: hypothetical protein U0694_11005 [Anaerolineae bacterium]